ncbi:MAG: ATP-binding protein [candidate division Zixibacteria bacterium]|nr:ATP-binding protein [candidate division Zixibacteria bacterium]
MKMVISEEIKEIIRRLEPILGVRAKHLWYSRLASSGPEDIAELESLIRILNERSVGSGYKNEILLPPPSRKTLPDRFRLGTVLYPDTEYSRIGLSGSDFIKHILIVGMTGAGKTNLCYNIVSELMDEGIPFLVFDWKGSYRPLRQQKGFENLKVIEIGSPDSGFTFNPLIPPPGINPKLWMPLLIDVIKHAFFVAHGVEYFFRKGIDHLYKQFGIYEGKTEYPTFVDLEKTLQKEFVRGREMLWMSSVKRSLASLTFSGILGEILNVRTQGQIEDLLSGQVIIELGDLATIERVFLIESLLLWIYHYRKLTGRREYLRHTIVIEEAHHILSSRKEFMSGEETIMETMIRMIREFGQSVIIVDQEPSKLSHSVMANTNCKICFNLGSGRDIQTMGRAMNLTSEESRFIDKLKVGHAILKLKERFHEPVHVQFPLAFKQSQKEVVDSKEVL